MKAAWRVVRVIAKFFLVGCILSLVQFCAQYIDWYDWKVRLILWGSVLCLKDIREWMWR